MHTATQLNWDLFSAEQDGDCIPTTSVFSDWGPLDRFGVVIHDELGAVGCSYLLQLSICAFFDAKPDRRDRGNRVYPDIFAFHVGGRYGDNAAFDIYPARKEVFVDNSPIAVLNAINDRGITRLAVPDRPLDEVQHEFKEPRHAIDRIKQAWAYSPHGRVDDHTLALTARSSAAEANSKITLDPSRSYHEIMHAQQANPGGRVPDTEVLRAAVDRSAEVTDVKRAEMVDARARLDTDSGRTETYRRITVADSLRTLHKGDAPAFETSLVHSNCRNPKAG